MAHWLGRNLPANWESLRKQRREMAGGQCEANSQITDWGRIFDVGTRCVRPGEELDHHENRDNHDLMALRWLCSPHHRKKTQQESAEARRKLGPVKPAKRPRLEKKR